MALDKSYTNGDNFLFMNGMEVKGKGWKMLGILRIWRMLLAYITSIRILPNSRQHLVKDDYVPPWYTRQNNKIFIVKKFY